MGSLLEVLPRVVLLDRSVQILDVSRLWCGSRLGRRGRLGLGGRGRRGSHRFSVLKDLDGSILISGSRYNIILVIGEVHNSEGKRGDLHLVGHLPQVALSHVDDEHLDGVILVDQIVEVSLLVWGEEACDG